MGPRIVLRPGLATLLLHGLMVYFLTANWASTESEITRVKPVTKVIQARLVDISEFAPKPKPKPKTKPKTTSKPKPVVKPKPKPKPKPVVKPVPKIPAKVAPVVEPRLTQAELDEIARRDLSRAVQEEEQSQAALSADQMTASYAALIQQTVVNYWSRPPSARNGMEALLAIQLIPTGEVVSVTVLNSSGNTAFDRSALNAVQKAGSFPELKNLPNREFEKTFRRFRLLFRPEDLRY